MIHPTRILPVTLSVTLAIAVLTCVPGGVHGQASAKAPAGVRQAIQARYNQFDHAYMRKDFQSVGKVFTADCVLRLESENRTMSAPRVVLGMQAVSKALTVSHARTRILSVQPQGAAYAVSAIWTGDSSFTPAPGTQDDQPRHGKTQQTYQDTWKKTGAAWQIVQRIIKG